METKRMNTEEQQEYLNNLFHGFFHEISDYVSVVNVRAGKRFVTQHDKIDGIYILIQGKVHVLEEYRNGDIHIFQENHVPSIFGEMESIAKVEYFLASLIAKTDCILYVVPIDIYLEFLKRHPIILWERSQWNMSLLLKSGRENRLALQLKSVDRMKLYLIKKYKKEDGQEVYTLSMTKQQIADEVAYSMKTVIRALKILEGDGYLKQVGHKITISETQYNKILKSLEQVT